MADKTGIAWCDSTFNPWIGCTKVGPGCDHCYAEADFDHRKHRVKWGPGQERRRTSAENWKKPLQWNRQHAEFFAENGRGRRVFCASMADVFDNEVPDEWRADLFDMIDATPNLDWLLLTKRIGNAMTMLPWTPGDGSPGCEPLPNVWLGATICNQGEADRDIPKLLLTPASVRFVSIEPMLGPIDLTRLAEDTCASECCGMQRLNGLTGDSVCDLSEESFNDGPRIDWVIAGGESGPKARPMHPAWARSLRDQCKDAGVPFLWKQWGEWAPNCLCDKPTACVETPRPEPGPMGCMFRCGKRAAGRLLDGVLHDGYPEARHG